MSGRFEGKCWECGGYGHTKADCPNLRGDTGSVDASVYRQPPAYGRRQREELVNERQEDPFAGFGGRFANQQQPQQPQQPQQQQQQYHGQMAPEILGNILMTANDNVDIGVLRHADQRTAGEGLEAYKESTGVRDASCVYVPEETGREIAAFLEARREIAAFLEARAAAKKRLQEPRSGRHVDIGTLPVLVRPGTNGPVRPQGQAGRGALPGARDEQPSRAGAGLLGHHRVEKPGASRSKGVRSVHTDHHTSVDSRALQAENRRDGPASSEVARDRLLRTMIRGDPFAVDMTLNQMDRRVPTDNADQSADTSMQDQVRKESDDAMDYKQEGEDES